MSLSASPVVYKSAAITTIVMIKIITFNMIIIHVHAVYMITHHFHIDHVSPC